MNPREDIEKLADTLSTQRDELIVRAHLAKLEAQDEWQELEAKFDQFRVEVDKVVDTAGEVGDDVVAAAKLLGDEVARGYDRLRKLF